MKRRDGATRMSSRRGTVYVLSGGRSRALGTRITLVALRTYGPTRTSVPLLAFGSSRPLWSGVALLPLRPEWTGDARITFVALRARRSLGTRRPRWSFRTLRPRLPLHIGHVLGQLAQAGFDRVQAVRRRRLAGGAGFNSTHLLGFGLRGSAFCRALGRAFCHSSLLRERAFRIPALPLTHQVPAARKTALRGSSFPRAIEIARHDACTGHRHPSESINGEPVYNRTRRYLVSKGKVKTEKWTRVPTRSTRSSLTRSRLKRGRCVARRRLDSPSL
jgi:hypothetical protein